MIGFRSSAFNVTAALAATSAAFRFLRSYSTVVVVAVSVLVYEVTVSVVVLTIIVVS